MASSGMQKIVAQPSARVRKARRRIIVNRGYQFRAMFPVLVYAGLLVLLILGLVLLPMHRQIAADPDPVIQAILGAQLLRIELWLAPLLVLSGCLAGIVALVQSRRVAGPIHRLREGLVKLAVGAPEPVVFRKRDEFHELEAPFAGVVSRMEDLTRSKLKMLRFLRHNLEGISQRVETQHISSVELRESLDVLMRDVDGELKKLQLKS
jgi:HAMP domain-containing protein